MRVVAAAAGTSQKQPKLKDMTEDERKAMYIQVKNYQNQFDQIAKRDESAKVAQAAAAAEAQAAAAADKPPGKKTKPKPKAKAKAKVSA